MIESLHSEAPIAEVACCAAAALAPVHKCALASMVKCEVPFTCDAPLTSLHLFPFPSSFASPHVHDKLRTESGHRHLFSSIARYRTLLGDIAADNGTSHLHLHFTELISRSQDKICLLLSSSPPPLVSCSHLLLFTIPLSLFLSQTVQ